MNCAKIISKTAIYNDRTFEFNKKDFCEKFIYHGKTYYFCFDKSIFQRSNFFREFLEYDEFDEVFRNFNTALGDVILYKVFDANYFADMIYMILYNSSMTSEQKASELSPSKMCHDKNANIREIETKYLSIHQALYRVLITYYGFDDDVKDILRESFLNFLKGTENFLYHSLEYFGMNFSKNTGGNPRAYLKKQIDKDNPIEIDLVYKRTFPDVMYIRFCFENAPFEFSKHFLLSDEKNDSCLCLINKYIKVEMFFTSKGYNFLELFLKQIQDKKLEIKECFRLDLCLSRNMRESINFSDGDSDISELVSMKSQKYEFTIEKIDDDKYDIRCFFYTSNYEEIKNFYIGLANNLDSVTLDASRMNDFDDSYLCDLTFTHLLLPREMAVLKNDLAWGKDCLRHVELPPNLEEIGNNFLGENCLIKTLVLPNTLKRIGFMFMANTEIEDFTFNEGLESIGTGFFHKNKKLKSIYIPSTLAEIWQPQIAKKKFILIQGKLAYENSSEININKDVKHVYFESEPTDHPLIDELKNIFIAYGVKFSIHPSKIPDFMKLAEKHHGEKIELYKFAKDETGCQFHWAEGHPRGTYEILFPIDDHNSFESAFSRFINKDIIPTKNNFHECLSPPFRYEKRKITCDIEKIEEFNCHITRILFDTWFIVKDMPENFSQLAIKIIPEMVELVNVSGIYESPDDNMKITRLYLWSYDKYFIIYELRPGKSPFVKYMKSRYIDILPENFTSYFFDSFNVFEKDDKDGITNFLINTGRVSFTNYKIDSIGLFLSKLYPNNIDELKSVLCKIALSKILE